jgi:hypothetical protein
VLSNTLVSEVSEQLPGFDASQITKTGATDLRKGLSPQQLPIVLRAYNKGIDNIFYLSLGLACVAFIASFLVEWKSVRKPEDELSEQSPEEAAAEQAAKADASVKRAETTDSKTSDSN